MLVALNDMKAYLSIPILDTTYDAFLNTQIDIVSEAIEGYCGRKFLEDTYTQVFYPKDIQVMPKYLMLYHYPVTEVISIFEDGVELTDFITLYSQGRIDKRLGRFFCYGVEDVTVNYKAGFITCPKTIESVVYAIVEEKYNKRKAGLNVNFGSDVQSISIPGSINIQFDYTLTQNDRKNAFGMILGNYSNVLDPYRSERVLTGTIYGGGYV